MKIQLFLGFVLCFLQASAQVFHVDDTSALLIKTTSQSPAHWYIEVISDLSVDTSLRWKAVDFQNVPSEWEISMDDQTNSYSDVQVGDSADFDFPANQTFPKKLIIGAMLNGTPGHGICYFDIYDPDNASVRQTISYEFIVTQATNSLPDLPEDSFVKFADGYLWVTNDRCANFSVYDSNGGLILENKLINKFNIDLLPKNQLSIIQVILEDKIIILKIIN